ncbi:phospholipase D family protein [Pseudoalteromonas sp. NJ631]|uniref:phospholipase D family protein n=1 Tax=Pseudoalteromonas sp. NJ631 TaxID=493915 RepID=UPI0003075DA1|nr:phospholipase D family protein [Pseudoalteromonas sp. NJ631]
MANFLNTTAINYHLEELIKSSSERLILISPYLKLNDRVKELLEDKDRMKIDIRVVYGKSELQPEEISWLNSLNFVRTSFCKNLHAKCYLNENSAIISSLNLYEFSQINNNEMGVFLSREDDETAYKDAFEECQRVIRISDEVKISMEKVTQPKIERDKLSTSKLARLHKLKTPQMIEQLKSKGYLIENNGNDELSESAISLGAEHKSSPRFGEYFVWPSDIEL